MASQVESIKWVPGTRLKVDGFRFVNERCRHYFLTHAHADHTTGLTRGSFSAGTIYCSQVTARLLAHEWGLRPPVVQALPLGEPVTVAGVQVTALDAHHCPGACMLLFEVPDAAQPDGVCRILHTGDCRWRPGLLDGLCGRRVDWLFLDTTYAQPRHDHPPQCEALALMVQAMRDALAEEPATLFVVAAYSIGKEKVIFGAAAAFPGMRVYASASKQRVLRLLDLPSEQLALLTDNPAAAQLHVTAWGMQAPQQLAQYLRGSNWARVVGFRPTGWTYRRSSCKLSVWREGVASVVGVPYSEHSSWSELRSLVAEARPRRLVPTVNAGSKAEAAALVDRFADLLDLGAAAGRIDRYLVRQPRQLRQRAQAQGHEQAHEQAHGQQQAEQQQAEQQAQQQAQSGQQAQQPTQAGQQAQQQVQQEQQQAQHLGSSGDAWCQRSGGSQPASSVASQGSPLSAHSEVANRLRGAPRAQQPAAAGGSSSSPLPEWAAGEDLQQQSELLREADRVQRLRKSLQQRKAAQRSKRSGKRPPASSGPQAQPGKRQQQQQQQQAGIAAWLRSAAAQ